MAGLTPEEQAFFDSGGDTSKLGDPVVEASTPSPLDTAGLGNAPAVAPVADPPAATAPPVVVPPLDDQTASLRQALADAQQQSARLEGQLEALKTPPAPAIEAPDPNKDPIGNMIHQLAKVNETVAKLQGDLTAQQTQQQQVQAFNNFKSQVNVLRDEFIKTNPDFQAAYDYVREARIADLRAYGTPEADIQKSIFQEEFQLAQRAVAQAKNPAAEIYEMAKRHGYKASATPTPPANAPAAAAKIAQLKAGQVAAPPALPASHVNEDITVEALRDASDADLNKLITDPAAWAKIAGKDNIPV